MAIKKKFFKISLVKCVTDTMSQSALFMLLKAAITHWGVHSDLTDRLHGLTLRLLFPFPAVVERY